MKFNRLLIILPVLFYYWNSYSQMLPPDSTRTVNLNEVTISVNKTEESRKTVAQKVLVLDAGQIANTQAQSSADLISATGTVFVQKSQLGGGSPVLRGFEASRILLVVDDVRMNNIIYRSGHIQNIVTVDNAMLDRVEVLFGPSSTIYGSDALGGVIHFYTKKPVFAAGDEKLKVKVNAFARYGSVDNEMTGHLDISLGGKRFASLTSVTVSDFGDLKSGSNQNPFYDGSFGERPYYVKRIDGHDSLVKNKDRYLQVQSGYSQYDFLQKFSFRQNDHTVHGLNVQYSTSSDVPRYDRLTDPAGNGLKYAQWYYGPQSRFMAAYDLHIDRVQNFFQNIHAGVNFQSIDESRHTRKFNNDALQNRMEHVDVFGASIDLQRIIHRNRFRIGLDARYNTLKSTANEENIVTHASGPLDTRYPDGKNNMADVSLYFSHTWTINEFLTLNDGVRIGYSSLHSTFVDTSFYHFPFTEANQSTPVYSGSIGLINTPSDDLKFSLLVSSGFRTPNVDDLSKVFDSQPGSVVVPNPDLKPEKTVNAEIGITKIFSQRIIWENYIYYTHFFDAIVTDKYTFNGQDSIVYDGTLSQVLANQNKERAYIYGFSSSIKAECTDNLELVFGMNYTYGRIKTDSSDYPLDHIPPFLAHLKLTYTNKNFSADFFADYNSWKKIRNYNLNGEDNAQYATPEGMPAWFTVNLHASYKVYKYITLQAGVDNIFDTQYRQFASGINAPGRNIFACIRFHY